MYDSWHWYGMWKLLNVVLMQYGHELDGIWMNKVVRDDRSLMYVAQRCDVSRIWLSWRWQTAYCCSSIYLQLAELKDCKPYSHVRKHLYMDIFHFPSLRMRSQKILLWGWVAMRLPVPFLDRKAFFSSTHLVTKLIVCSYLLNSLEIGCKSRSYHEHESWKSFVRIFRLRTAFRRARIKHRTVLTEGLSGPTKSTSRTPASLKASIAKSPG